MIESSRIPGYHHRYWFDFAAWSAWSPSNDHLKARKNRSRCNATTEKSIAPHRRIAWSSRNETNPWWRHLCSRSAVLTQKDLFSTHWMTMMSSGRTTSLYNIGRVFGFKPQVLDFLLDFLSWYHLPCICNSLELEPVILHGICYTLAWSLGILHGICYIWQCLPSILNGICHILALQPHLNGICYILVLQTFMWEHVGFLRFSSGFQVGFHLGFDLGFGWGVSLGFHLGSFRGSLRVSFGGSLNLSCL